MELSFRMLLARVVTRLIEDALNGYFNLYVIESPTKLADGSFFKNSAYDPSAAITNT